MISKQTLYDFDDLLITPAVLSTIRSRKDVKPKIKNMLPIMTAPMDTVINQGNYKLFIKNGIMPVLPRTTNPGVNTEVFQSYGLDDFKNTFLNTHLKIESLKTVYALIDVANGHMEHLYTMAKLAKERYGYKLCLMVGNVANPKTFEKYCQIGVDYVRIGIGNGSGCLTSEQTGVGYPLPALISRCRDIINDRNRSYDERSDGEFEKYKYKTKIVADGGFKKNSDIIKGLGLGADYIMLGGVLNKALESAGETTNESGNVVDQFDERTMERFEVDIPLFKTFRGMSTKEVQKEWGREILKTSEGVSRKNRVEYTLSGWTQNFEDYLRSAMSYTGKKELHQFIGGVDFEVISEAAFRRFNK